jgi:hypothetical protein
MEHRKYVVVGSVLKAWASKVAAPGGYSGRVSFE